MTTPTLPTFEPSDITRGETVSWTKVLTDYPPGDGWTLTYYFRGAGKGVDVVATADGSGYKATMTAAQSTTLAAGRYDVEGWVSKGVDATLEQHLVAKQTVKVNQGLSDVLTTEAFDGRSETKQTLDAIRAAMAKTATRAQLQRTIGDKHIQFMTMADLIIAETRFQQLYNQEVRNARMKQGAPFLKNIHTRFVRPE